MKTVQIYDVCVCTFNILLCVKEHHNQMSYSSDSKHGKIEIF